MSVVAAFLGGILFTIFAEGLALWWFTRSVDAYPLEDDCQHCNGTGIRRDAPAPPMAQP